MPFDLQDKVAEAERLALPFMARPVDMRWCPVHPAKKYQRDWTGLLVCPDPSHQPDRGE
ncbi:hypothetical protein ACLGIH_20330 [Streptomyces sp. HMX87]|uniref:hypothetical protein n=1 Tax=Streptomyces sp. HMX87 TaxID=3390849 RepID=UPI003A8C80DC